MGIRDSKNEGSSYCILNILTQASDFLGPNVWHWKRTLAIIEYGQWDIAFLTAPNLICKL